MIITNEEVFNALNNCIEERWKRIAAGTPEMHTPNCQLCVLFGGGLIANYGKTPTIYTPQEECKGCPVYLRNDGKGCADGSSYSEFGKVSGVRDDPDHMALRKTAATRMLNDLIEAREYFFGSKNEYSTS